jgi:hypothetical protein
VTRRVRRAGRGRLPEGGSVVWSVSEGSRGRRWREALRDPDGRLVSSLLLETFPNGRFAHIELSTAAGLLTLHPEADGTLHGNVITETGIAHVAALPWSERSVILVDGSPIAAAAALHSIARYSAPPTSDVDVTRIDRQLAIAQDSMVVRRSANGDWSMGDWPSMALDDDGLPRLSDSATFALEA